MPLLQQLAEDLFAVTGEPVEPLVAFVFFAPFAGQQSLSFQAAEEGIEGAFVDDQSMFGEGFTQGVAVVLLAKLRENGEGQTAAAKLEAKIFEEVF